MLGIDVSKATLACTLVDPTTRRPRWRDSVPNTVAGITRLLQRTPPEASWVVEPTGPYSRQVVGLAQDAGREVLLAPPREAKAFLGARSPRAKTDRLDSLGLAHYGLAMPLRPFPRKRAGVEQVEQLLAARKGISQSLASLRQQQQTLPYAAEHLEQAIAALRQEQAAIDRRLTHRAAADAEWTTVQLLQSVPGIGVITATTVAACLASREFAHPDQFVAYIGLDVRVRESGQRRGTSGLSRRGHAELRRLFYLCAQSNLRSRDPANPFKQQYERERAKGLPSTAALCAVARKLARTCWSIAKYQTAYDPARVNHQRGRSGSPATATIDTEP